MSVWPVVAQPVAGMNSSQLVTWVVTHRPPPPHHHRPGVEDAHSDHITTTIHSAFTCTNDVGMALEWLQSTVLLNTTQLLASGTTFTGRRISKITNVGSCWNSAIMEWLWGPLSTNTDYRFPCVLQVYSTFTSPRLKLWNITLTPNLSAAPSPPSLTKQLLVACCWLVCYSGYTTPALCNQCRRHHIVYQGALHVHREHGGGAAQLYFLYIIL